VGYFDLLIWSGKLLHLQSFPNTQPIRFGLAMIHLPLLFQKSQFRKCTITTNKEWQIIIDNCFLPDYKYNKSWEGPSAKNYTLIEKSLLSNEKLKNYSNIVIITAYDPESCQRLIVDGVHRAIALQIIINERKNIPAVEIVECYGSNVRLIFKSDFLHLN
jgi:hypothetical protein